MAAAITFSVLLSLTPPGDTLELTRLGARPCSTAEHVVGLMPFGAGQWLHGEFGLGVALATSQAAALAVNVGSYFDARGLARDRAQSHVVAQYASLAVFGLLWSVGALQAQSFCDAGVVPAAASLSLSVPAPPLPALARPEKCAPCASPRLALSPCSCPARSAPAGAIQLALGGMWAHVDVDGERILDNQMGAFSLSLPPGEHVLRFSQPRARPQEVRVVVDAEAPPSRVVVRLQPLPARLRITGAPVGGLVRVAERRVLVGAGPLVIEVPLEGAGQKEVVEVLGPTGATLLHRQVHLSPDQETTLALEPE